MSKIVLVIALLNLLAFSVRHVTKGYAQLGFLTIPLIRFSEFPRVCMDAFNNTFFSEKWLDTSTDFQPINRLNYDVFATNSNYKDSK